jgi:hypothetical protein
MKATLFMENMWEYFLFFYFVPYNVNIPMYSYVGDLNKSNRKKIFVGYKGKFTFQTIPL